MRGGPCLSSLQEASFGAKPSKAKPSKAAHARMQYQHYINRGFCCPGSKGVSGHGKRVEHGQLRLRAVPVSAVEDGIHGIRGHPACVVVARDVDVARVAPAQQMSHLGFRIQGMRW